jgi:hypothetical protein
VLAKSGAPAQEVKTADGARLFYPNGPMGKGARMVFNVDAKGVVTGVEDGVDTGQLYADLPQAWAPMMSRP